MSWILYSGSGLDRADQVRRDPAAVGALQALPSARFLPFWRGLALMADQPPGAVAARGATARRLVDASPGAIFLGLDEGAPLFALDVSSVPGGEAGPELDLPGRWLPLRTWGGTLPAADAALLAYAQALVLWNGRTRHCSECGAPTRMDEAGHVRACTDSACGARHFPRSDPAIIVLVEGEGGILLGRQPSWPAGMWSCLAGFVEPGETLEEAVAREVREESGILVAEIRYAASQPWPFPSSLMVGFTAKAAGGTLVPDRTELEDARWFGSEELAAFDDRHRTDGSGRPFLPRRDAIARHLIDAWLAPLPTSPHLRRGEE